MAESGGDAVNQHCGVSCTGEANGMVVADQLLRKHGVIREDEVWVHGMWTPDKVSGVKFQVG